MNNGTPPGGAPNNNNNNKRHPALAPLLPKSLITKKIPAPLPEDVARAKKAALEDAKKEEVCTVCLNALPDIGRGVLACGHTFCFGCIHIWSQAGDPALCPTCRVPFNKIKKTLTPKDMAKEKLRNERDKKRKNATKKQRDRMRRRRASVKQPCEKVFVKDVRVRKLSHKKRLAQAAREAHPQTMGSAAAARQATFEAYAVQHQANLLATRARREAELRDQHQTQLTAAREVQQAAARALAEAQARQAAGTRARQVAAAEARAEQGGTPLGGVSASYDSVNAAAATPAAAAPAAAAPTAAAAPAAAAAAATPSGAAAPRGPRMRYTVAGFTNDSIIPRGRSFATAAEAAAFSAGHASYAAAAAAAAAAAPEPASSNSSMTPTNRPRTFATAAAGAANAAAAARAEARSAATAAAAAAAAATTASEQLRARMRADDRSRRLGGDEEEERSRQRERQQDHARLMREMDAVNAAAFTESFAYMTRETERLRAQQRTADRSRRLGEGEEEEERSQQRERQQEEEARRRDGVSEVAAAAVAAAELPSSRMDLLARLAGLEEPMPARRTSTAVSLNSSASPPPSISATARVTRSVTRNTRWSSASSAPASATATEVVAAAAIPTRVSPRRTRTMSVALERWVASGQGGGGGPSA